MIRIGHEIISKYEFNEWIHALRSGKYKQGAGVLQPSKKTFCCLGVACVIYIPKEKRILDMNRLRGNYVYESEQPNAPEWLMNVNTDFDDKCGVSLSMLNDAGKYPDNDPFTFDEIADLLELVYIHKILD